MHGYALLIPELLVLVGALVALFGEFVPGRDRSVALIGAALAAVATALVAMQGTADTLFGGMLQFDGTARWVRVAVGALTALWLLWFSARDIPGERGREAVALVMFSSLGGMLLASAVELVTLFMALELSTMPAYVLMGYRREDVKGLEGALKYFLLSMLTSLIMLYGMSFLYGLSGSTMLTEIGASLSAGGTLALVAAVLTLTGLFAKLSAAPFHYWAPDAYAGAPAASVAFVSTAPKVAGTAVLVRFVAVLAPAVPTLWIVLLVAAVASMALGNLAALTQTDMRRLMAYSGVAHSGYLILALAGAAYAGGTAAGLTAALFYAVAYAVPSMAVMMVVAEEGTDIASASNLVSRRPAAAWAMAVWLISLIGIPPLAGFFGKLQLFSAGLSAGSTWMTAGVVVAILMSVVSAGYYFRVIRAMFFGSPAEEPAPEPVTVTTALAPATALALAVLATVAIGLAAGPVLAFLRG